MTVEQLDAIARKVDAGDVLSDDDVAALASTRDLVTLGALADTRRRAIAGDRVTFVRVMEQAAAVEVDPVPPTAGELRLVGCPDGDVDLPETVRRAVDRAGEVPVTGFCLDELVDRCAGEAGRFDDLAGRLREAGLCYVAEARLDRTPDATWLARAAAAGLPVARLTVHEPGAGGLAAVRRVASWGAAARVRAFAPLPRVGLDRPATGYDDVRQVALARLLVDNIESIQVDWRLYGPKLAQVALTFGASDVDGVSPVDSLEHGRRRAALEEITQNIRAAALVPVQRNGRFETKS